MAWPEKKFSQEDLGRQALLGTPHGSGIAWMLIEHVDELGKRDIEVTVFSGQKPENERKPGDEYFYYLLFNLKPFGS